ncbi:MAG: hypothetical protein HC878_00265 [Leptolyngbyaceae cyanobacterium SL_5_14]|nr:hypothetical protein [Leptolyngbyaceae cyanobacterium SL_5_14]
MPDSVFDQRLQEVCDRYNIYRAFCDPAEPSSILRLRQYPQDGLKRAVRGFNRIEEGIKILNSLFYKGLFTISEQSGMSDLLLSYSREVDEIGNILPKISPGQNDHPIDAMRYVIATLEYKTFLANQRL